MEGGSTAAALISSGVLQQHLLPRLHLGDLHSIECVSTAFGQLLAQAPENVWEAAIARTVPPSHPLARVQLDYQQAVYQCAALQRAIDAQDISIMCVVVQLAALASIHFSTLALRVAVCCRSASLKLGRRTRFTITRVTCTDTLVAIIGYRSDGSISGDNHVLLFNVALPEKPVQHVCQKLIAVPPEDAGCMLAWSPDTTYLALCFTHQDLSDFGLICLSAGSEAERQACPCHLSPSMGKLHARHAETGNKVSGQCSWGIWLDMDVLSPPAAASSCIPSPAMPVG